MNLLTPFIVLIERRRLPRAIVATVTAIAVLLSNFGLGSAYAAPNGTQKKSKVARDLDAEMVQTGAPKAKWARDLNGVRHVQVVLVSNDNDPLMSNLRAHVLQLGGSVHAVHPAVHAMTVQVKASDVAALAQRSDVLSVSPNRVTQRTFSALESMTGALTANVRTYSSKTAYSGVDGTGVGIAVLDSGVMKSHDSLDNSLQRVKRNVNMLNASLANWTTGVSTTSLNPGSTALANYEAAIAADSTNTQDPFGHGTHVASVAAGRYYAPAANTNGQEINGIAPNANIYDVRVLNNYGFGTEIGRAHV